MNRQDFIATGLSSLVMCTCTYARSAAAKPVVQGCRMAAAATMSCARCRSFWHVNVIVCESDYRALRRGTEHSPPPFATAHSLFCSAGFHSFLLT
jgi:hypothetical protein